MPAVTKPAKRVWRYGKDGKKEEITGQASNPLGAGPLIQIGPTPNWNTPGHFDR